MKELLPPLFKLRERADGSVEALDELHPAVSWFEELRPFAFRTWHGPSCYGVDGVLMRDAWLKAGESWPEGSIPTNIVDVESIERYGLVPADDAAMLGALDDYLFGRIGPDGGVPRIPNGEYVLLQPGSSYDPVVRAKLVGALSLAYLHVPIDFVGMRAWLGKHRMKGLTWVARDRDGNEHRATVERAHMLPIPIKRAS